MQSSLVSQGEQVIWWGLLLTLPIERFLVLKVAGFTFRPTYAFLCLLAALYLRETTLSDWRKPFAVLSVLSLVPAAFSLSHSYSLRYSLAYLGWATFTVVCWVVVFCAFSRNRNRVEFANSAYIYTSSFWAIVVIAQWIGALFSPSLAWSWVGSVPRVAAFTYEPSYLAFYLLPALAASIIQERAASILLITLGIMFSTARTGLLGLGLITVGSILWRKGRLALTTGILIGIVALTIMPGRFWRPTEAQSPVKDLHKFTVDAATLKDHSSTLPRLASWKEALDLFLEHPITGVGIGAYGYAAPPHPQASRRSVKTTNLWLEVAAEQGIPGLISLAVWTAYPILVGVQKGVTECSWSVCVAVLNAVLYCFIQTWWRPYLWFTVALAYSFLETESVLLMKRLPSPIGH